MFRALSTAASGMQAEETRLGITANNIANVSTPGFKRSRAQFEDLMYAVTQQPGAPTSNQSSSPTGQQIGMGVRLVGTDRTFTQGELRQTGKSLDIAIEGSGFYPIQLPSGEMGYTRDGGFSLDAQGRLVNSSGYPLAGSISVPPDAQSITIGADGLVTVSISGDPAPVEVGEVQLAVFANPGGLLAMGHNLFKETMASGPAILGAPGENGAGALMQGALEMSNVKVVEEMIDLIAGQRAYEVSAKVMRAADEMLQQTAQIR